MQFAEYFICPFCYANTGVSTTLGKVSFGTDELRVKEMFHNMPTMKVSTVPQLFYTDGSSRHGYFRTILNAKCQECGREVLSKTVIRDVFITFVRNMTRNFLHELDLEPTAKFNELMLLRNNFGSTWKYFRNYKSYGSSNTIAYALLPFVRVLRSNYSNDCNGYGSESNDLFSRFKWGFAVVDWYDMFDEVTAGLRSYINGATLNREVRTKVDGFDYDCLRDETLVRIFGFLEKASECGIEYSPLILLDCADAISSIENTNFDVVNTYDALGIVTYQIRSNGGRYYHSFMTTDDYHLKGVREDVLPEEFGGVHPCNMRDECFDCTSSYGYPIDSFDDDSCDGCDYWTPFVRAEACHLRWGSDYNYGEDNCDYDGEDE